MKKSDYYENIGLTFLVHITANINEKLSNRQSILDDAEIENFLCALFSCVENGLEMDKIIRIIDTESMEPFHKTILLRNAIITQLEREVAR